MARKRKKKSPAQLRHEANIRRAKSRSRKRKETHRETLAQARAIILAHNPGANHLVVPATEAIHSDLMKLRSIPWTKAERIRRLQTLFTLRVLHTHRGHTRPNPDGDVVALRSAIDDAITNLEVKDLELAEAQGKHPDRPVGRPAALLLGTAHETRNSAIGVRRTLAAQARHCSVETLRRHHEKDLCLAVAEELVDQEVQLARRLGIFAKRPKKQPLLSKKTLRKVTSQVGESQPDVESASDPDADGGADESE